TSLKARADAAGLADRVLWLGHVDGARKQAVLAAADVFVLPSFSENFGIAAVEALLAGVPCVLSEDVAIARTIEGAGAGMAVRPEPAAVALALARILELGPTPHQGVAHAMGQRARQLAQEDFSASVMARRLIALYEDVRGSLLPEAAATPAAV